MCPFLSIIPSTFVEKSLNAGQWKCTVNTKSWHKLCEHLRPKSAPETTSKSRPRNHTRTPHRNFPLKYEDMRRRGGCADDDCLHPARGDRHKFQWMPTVIIAVVMSTNVTQTWRTNYYIRCTEWTRPIQFAVVYICICIAERVFYRRSHRIFGLMRSTRFYHIYSYTRI